MNDERILRKKLRRLNDRKYRQREAYWRKKSWLKKRYGITMDQYEGMMIRQKSRCAICLKRSSKTLHIDHCHKSGTVRKLLCQSCNLLIGYAKDRIKILKSAIKYLEGFNGKNRKR